ncbi:MAG: hypothetical protein M1608_13750, partial [Candidatus Omnitrophica bacterium]|nr:hypothetical protein [Candidatus Omnitrophota bacterium]
MSANYSPPNSGRRTGAVFIAALTACVLWAGAHFATAATITNVTLVNVTPTSFGVLWRTAHSTPSIALYADPGGLTNLAGQLGIENFPLHTGNPALAGGYERRQSQAALRQRMENFGLMQVRVTGCHPGTTYYFRLTSTLPDSSTVVYPVAGPLPGVTTERENTFVVNDQVLILDVPGLDTYGQLVTLTHPQAAHPLAAVVGDGAGTNQVFFNVNDLFAAAAGGGNFTPLGPQDFTVDVLGPNQADVIRQFTLVFGTDFTVAPGSYASIGTEFLALTFGSTLMQTGQTNSVPVNLNSSADIADIRIAMDIPPGHLTNFNFQALAPEIDPGSATIILHTGSTALLHLVTRTGQTLVGSKQIAQLVFTAVPNQPSAFVPLKLTSISAAKPDASKLTNVFAQSGRVVVIGQQALLEAGFESDGTRQLMLYGKPGSSYAIEYSTNIISTGPWAPLYHLPLTTMSASLQALNRSLDPVFYRAFEFFADPPILEAYLNPDQSRSLLMYGQPTRQYTLQYSTNLPNVVAWFPLH